VKRKSRVAYLLIGLLLFAGRASQSSADSATVLPKGRSSVSVEGKYYFEFEKKFDSHGNTVDIAEDYNSNLNSTVFPGLQQLETFFGLPPGSASIGTSDIAYKFGGSEVISLLSYGVTDRLTIGVRIPYYWRKNDVSAALDTSQATVGKNPALNILAPLFVPGTVPLTTQDAQNLIGRGLDINGDGQIDISGFGYKPIKSWSGNGIADIEVGGKYQYLKTDKWRLAFTGAVRLPTGEIDDPDNLADIGMGDGAYALLFQSQNDFVGISHLLLNATFRYDLYLPNSVRLRVPDSVHQPLTLNEEYVDRKIGDKFEIEISGTYDFFDAFSFSLLYKYGYKFKNQVSGNKGFNYESLEDETNMQEHAGIVSLWYSTFPLYLAKQFPIPMVAGLSYRDRFAGTNLLKSKYISLTLAIYF
jgi:hypothetical protein